MAVVNGKQNFTDAQISWRLRILRRINRLARQDSITEQERMDLQDLVVPDLHIDHREPGHSTYRHSTKRVG